GQHGVLLASTEDEELGAARRARLIDRLLPELEVALDVGRVVRAAVEAAATAPARFDLDDVPSAFGAGDAERDRLGVLTTGVTGARQELAVAARLDHHRLAALVALVIGDANRERGRARAVAQVLRDLALRVRGAA